MQEPSSNELPEFHIGIWEWVTVVTGFVALLAVGVTGLGLKFIGNAVNPNRAEAIAQSLISYSIPGGSVGLFATNIGAAKIALVGSQATVPHPPSVTGVPLELPKVELFIARLPIDNSLTSATPSEMLASASGLSFSYQPTSTFQPVTTRTERRLLCGSSVSVRVETGKLFVTDLGGRSLPAIRYDTGVVLDEYIHVVTLYALGDDAQTDAETVFQSLQCR